MSLTWAGAAQITGNPEVMPPDYALIVSDSRIVGTPEVGLKRGFWEAKGYSERIVGYTKVMPR